MAKQTKFVRKVDGCLISALKQEPLFQDHLRDDCIKGTVYPAIRNDRVAFYHKGGMLFEYCKVPRNGGYRFRANIRYALGLKSEYLTQEEMCGITVDVDFARDYRAIKTQCGRLAGPERTEVADLCREASLVLRKRPSIVVLDTEVGFSGDESSEGTDFIDALLYDLKTHRIVFLEVKRWGDSRHREEVAAQVKRYSEQISAHQNEIQHDYVAMLGQLRDLFELTDICVPSNPETVEVDPDVRLIVTGYGQADERKAKRIPRELELKGDAIGGMKRTNEKTLRKWMG